MRTAVDLPSLGTARIEAIKRIWALVSTERYRPLRLDRRIEVTDDDGTVLIIVTFEEALAPAFMGWC